MESKVTLNMDISKVILAIDGMTDLITAAKTFCNLVEAGDIRSDVNYNRFTSALEKINSYMLSNGPDAIDGSFFHFDGKPAAPDIDDELGQLLLACLKGFEFIHEGPAIQATEDVIQSMYQSNVVKVIPKLKAVIESRVMPKYSFGVLVDRFFPTYVQLQAPLALPIDHILMAASFMESKVDHIEQAAENYDPKSSSSFAQTILANLADITIMQQQIMTQFGWTWDDVKLRARQEIAKQE